MPVFCRKRSITSPVRTTPACGVKYKLNSRALGQTDISLLECPGCAGIWIGEETFELLAEKSRQSVLPEQLTTGPAGKRAGSAKQDGSMYRRCPRCAKHMNRRNFGHRSGIVIDTCKEHGFWFDAHELDQVLRWIRQGGEQRALRRQADEERQAERQSRVRYDRESRSAGPGTFESGLKREPTFGIGDLIGLFFDV